ncbi:hypothetical protein KHC23_01345 [Ancylobacter dichloromethanicus]|uniref:hypothetical protein n=1 Tax=Ancylobacter dichloromethanicus TaxID=518825 RepID=UPI001BCE5969|nr:hypothetical protein [Ancylobacter dichloromethanicus]MBS7552305.1 hypothetical protein [Ancylobacter dichloromethanicus]
MRRNVPATLIPYGVDNWSPDRITLSRWNEDGVEIAADFPFALVDRSGGPLRLNNCGLDLPAAGAFEAEAPLAGRLAAHLARLSGQWNLMGARFVQRYFDFLAHRIATHRGQLEARLAPFDGLFRAEDFLYSAPVPLPRAFLYAPEPTPGARGGAADDLVQVDFAFWLGDAMRAVLPAQSTLPPAATRRRKERLAAAAIAVVTYGPADLADPQFGLFHRLLGPELSAFWEGETLPCAPGTSGGAL